MGGEYDPAGHGLQDVDLSDDEKYPTGQMSQDTEPCIDEYEPVGHGLQDVDPADEEY